MVNKNSGHKLVLVLIHAFLEWVLIALLLLNSLFNYLIAKFASHFGLQKPCIWCSRVDHFWGNKPNDDNNNNKYSYADLFCESHALEISNHARFTFRGEERLDPYLMLGLNTGTEFRRKIVSESKKLDSNSNSVGILEHCSFGSRDVLDDEDEEDHLSSSSMFICYEKEAMEESKAGSNNGSGDFVAPVKEDLIVDVDIECSPERGDDRRLIPVELIDSSTVADRGKLPSNVFESNADRCSGRDSEEEKKRMDVFESNDHDLCSGRDCEEEKKRDLASKGGEQVLTAGEVRALQINVKKAVMTKLVQIPVTEAEEERRTSVSNQLHKCDFESYKNPEKDTETRRETTEEMKELEKLPDTPTSMESLNQAEKRSTTSETEWGDQLSAEQLRKILRAVYAELEEERSASAVAANQTMAMITRLQEEKAAVQMEALQYQRMMEEQSEYDQEALHLLNDLIVKRENEKRELERDLDLYREKLAHYKDTERHNGDDDDDDDLEAMAMECVGHVGALDESLNEFEEERLSILDQLRALEGKLEGLDGDEGFDGSLAKKLLPFLDEAELEDGNNGTAVIEEEVGHVYERLEALEADREFLKNCVSSVKKGDKGVDLLQEILQNLRDLRTLEQQVEISPKDHHHQGV